MPSEIVQSRPQLAVIFATPNGTFPHKITLLKLTMDGLFVSLEIASGLESPRGILASAECA